MDSALEQVKRLAATAGGVARQNLMATLHNLAYSMETADETLHRYGAMNLQTAIVKTGFDLGLFKYLVEAGGPVSVEDAARKTGAEASLLSRLLKYLASIGAVDIVGVERYSANQITENLTQDVTEAGVNHYFATVSPIYQVLPAYFKKNGYKNPTHEVQTAFQEAWNTPLHGFAWFTDHPENLAYFNDFMAFRREPEESWLTVYPLKEAMKTRDSDPSKPVYVNIGGGIGHQCAQFKEKFPEIPGRVILQDLPHSIAKALPTPGVENMAYNFFEPQPVKGAKFYFMRGVFHNHPPHKVLKLLENTKAAMAPDSVFLIDEMILPEKGGHIDAVSMDITMLAAFAGAERSESQWRDLLGQAGLKLVKTYVYNAVTHESVMEIRLP